MHDSLCCTAETDTAVESNYAPIKKNKKKKTPIFLRTKPYQVRVRLKISCSLAPTSLFHLISYFFTPQALHLSHTGPAAGPYWPYQDRWISTFLPLLTLECTPLHLTLFSFPKAVMAYDTNNINNHCSNHKNNNKNSHCDGGGGSIVEVIIELMSVQLV